MSSSIIFSILLSLFSITFVFSHIRVKRDFMYVSTSNDSDCFQDCNTKWRDSFEYSLNISLSDFYEFPLHPILLDHSSYLLYCKLAEQKTTCYSKECGDQSADTVFSPSNFICDFKRQLYTEVRSCLAESEPITFLKCDQSCHEKIVVKSEEKKIEDTTVDTVNSVYSYDQLENYEKELETLCSFQQCYLECMVPVVKEVCAPSLAARAVDLIESFVKWHAIDIYEWHVSSDRLSQLAPSCSILADKTNKDDREIINLISR